jgi:DNA-binding XRE family transcriptional regulator
MTHMNFNKLIRDAISKGASRIVRKPMAAMRKDVADLKRQVAQLRRQVNGLQRLAPKPVVIAAEPDEAADGKRVRRPTAAAIRQLRQKLGLTQGEMARLLGISSITVSKWERADGLLTLRRRTMGAYQALRGLGKREVRAKLAEG